MFCKGFETQSSHGITGCVLRMGVSYFNVDPLKVSRAPSQSQYRLVSSLGCDGMCWVRRVLIQCLCTGSGQRNIAI